MEFNDKIKECKCYGTWSLVTRPRNANVIVVKWVYKAKLNQDGTLNKHKVWLVVKGNVQQYGIEYGETFTIITANVYCILFLTLQGRCLRV